MKKHVIFFLPDKLILLLKSELANYKNANLYLAINSGMLSKKTQYAFQALMYLSHEYEKGPVLIADIARKKRIPLKFLENILLELKKAGILDSKKGKGGGYFLAKEPHKILLADVLRLVDGPIALLPCVSLHFYERCKNCDEKNCGLNRVMIEVRDANLAILEKKTVADISDV